MKKMLERRKQQDDKLQQLKANNQLITPSNKATTAATSDSSNNYNYYDQFKLFKTYPNTPNKNISEDVVWEGKYLRMRRANFLNAKGEEKVFLLLGLSIMIAFNLK